MDDNKIKINVYLNGQYYPMTINRDEEEDVRAAAKRVNDYLSTAKQYFDNGELGENRLLTMVSYQFALSCIRSEQKSDAEPFTDKIKEWDKLLESQLMADYTNDIAFVDKESEEE